MALQYSPSVVTNGLVTCIDAANVRSYPGSGATWTNLAGSINTTLVGSPAYSSGNMGALTFDGTTNYAYFASPSPMAGSSLFTIEMWINITTLSGAQGGVSYKGVMLIAGGTGTGTGQPELIIRSASLGSSTPATLIFGAGNAAGSGGLNVDVSSLMTNGNWYQIVLTRPTTSSQVAYLNGVQIGTGNHNHSYADGQTDIGALHGNASWSGYLNGKMSNVKLYNRALSAAEVSQNFNALRGRFSI